MYSQAGGLEQSTFDSSSGSSETRSKRMVSWLSKVGVPQSGGPNDIQLDGKNILMPFRKDIASKICKRYKTLDFITPN
jgi:hypothetical protein